MPYQTMIDKDPATGFSSTKTNAAFYNGLQAHYDAKIASDINVSASQVLSDVNARAGGLNVINYGAVGNGTTSDRTAFQSAIDAASALAVASGGQVVVTGPPAKYHLPALTAKVNFTEIGAGHAVAPALRLKTGVVLDFPKGTIFSTPYGSSGLEFPAGKYEESTILAMTGEGDNTAVRGITFQHGYSGSVEGNTYSVVYGPNDNFMVEDCEFRNNAGDGVYVWTGASSPRAATNFAIRRNRFHDLAGNMVILANTHATAKMARFRIEDNDGYNALTAAESIAFNNKSFEYFSVARNIIRDWGSMTAGGDNCTISENILNGRAGDQGGAFGYHGGDNATVSGNVFNMGAATGASGSGSGANCIQVSTTGGAATNMTITGNTLIAGRGPAIIFQVTGSSNVTVASNTIETKDSAATTPSTLSFANIDGLTVAGNTIKGVGNNIIEVVSTSQNATVSNNKLTPGRMSVGGSVSVTGNIVTGVTNAYALNITGSDVVVTGNRLSNSYAAGAVVNTGGSLQRIIINDNILANTAGGTVSFVTVGGGSNFVHVLDNLTVGTGSGGDGISLSGANSVKRVPA
jgi:hypothetical protein